MISGASSSRVSHGQSWVSWMLWVALLVYVLLMWLLEKINLVAILQQLPNMPAVMVSLATVAIHLVRHLIPLILGWWFAYGAAVETIQRLYELPDKEAAANFLSQLRTPNVLAASGLALNPQTVEAERPNSVLLRVGGPGKIRVAPYQAVVTEDNGRFARVLGAGTHILHPFEFVHTVVDLQQQERTVSDIKAQTRDNIGIVATVAIMYRIRQGEESPTENKPYPFDEDAVRAAAYAQTVLDEGTAVSWEGRPAATVSGKLAAAISQYRLDEIMHPDGRTDEPYRALQQQVWRAARAEMSGYGVELISVHIAQLKPDKEIEEFYIRFWQSRWETQARLSLAEGRAIANEEIEVARAEAEIAMIHAILEGIQRARQSGATSQTSNIVALRLIDTLERMAEESDQTTAVLPVLTNLRQELLATVNPPAPPITTLPTSQLPQGNE